MVELITTITTSKTYNIVSFDVVSVVVDLFSNVRINVVITCDDAVEYARVVNISGADYLLWSTDDYIIQYIITNMETIISCF